MKIKYTSKKIILVFTVVSLISGILLGGCEAEISDTPNEGERGTVDTDLTNVYGEYESLIIDKANDGGPLRVDTSYYLSISPSDQYSEEPVSKRSITVFGKSYEGTIRSSSGSYMRSYILDEYYDSSQQAYFSLRRYDGKLMYFSVYPKGTPIKPYPASSLRSEEDAEELAMRIVKDLAGNIEGYSISTEKTYNDKSGKVELFTVSLVREICGYPSSDTLRLKLTVDGGLTYFSANETDVFSDASLELNDQKINASIGDKIALACNECDFEMDSYEVVKQKLILTPDRYIGVLSEVSVFGTDEYGYAFHKGTAVIVLTVLKKY